MLSFIRGMGLVWVSMILLGLSGCGTDNETEASRLQASSGPPPTSTEKGQAPPPTPHNMEEYMKNYKAPYQGTKYPGAPKAKPGQ